MKYSDYRSLPRTRLSILEKTELDHQLGAQYDAERAKPVASVPCDGCRLCCSGDTTNVVLLPEERGQYDSVELMGLDVLRRRDNGDCVYLYAEGCSIQDRKPRVCRTFDCRDEDPNLPVIIRKRGRALS